MKKRCESFILFFILLSFSVFSAVYVDSKNIMKEPKVDYIEMVWEKKNGEVTDITIRYGTSIHLMNRTGELTGRAGRKLEFISIHDAVMYIRKNGWRDIRNYVKCTAGKSVYHFIFKKK